MKRVAYVVILVAMFVLTVAFFARPARMELVTTPPSEFLEARPEWDARRRDAEARLALAYWDCALVSVQRRYPPGVNLPEEPPAYFQVNTRLLAGELKLAPQSRDRYWQRLRKVWGLPHSWREVRVRDFGWMKSPFEFWQRVIGR